MIYIILLANLCVFEAGLAFPQRNDENQKPDIFYQDYDLGDVEHFYRPKILVREPRQASRRSFKKKYVPFIDGKPISIPDTDPEKKENHVYDAEAEKAFLQSYLFPQTKLDVANEKSAKHSKGDIKKVTNNENEYVIGTKSSIIREPKHKISTSKPIPESQNYKGKHGSKKSYGKMSENFKLNNIEDTSDQEPLFEDSLTDANDYEYDSPVVVESLTKEQAGTDSESEYEYDSPVVVESLTKEQTETEHAKYDDPIVDALTKEKIETDKILSEDEYGKPVVIKSLVKKVKPNENIHYNDEDYDKPVAIETVVKKPYKAQDVKIGDYDTPVVIEALVKKDSAKTKPNKEKPKYDEYGKLTVSEAFTKTKIPEGDYKESDVYASKEEKDLMKDNDHHKKVTKPQIVHGFTKKEVSKVNDKSKSTKTNYKRKTIKPKLKPSKSSVYIENEGKTHVEDIHQVEHLGGRASETETQHKEIIALSNVPTLESNTDLNFFDRPSEDVNESEDSDLKRQIPIESSTDLTDISDATSSSRNFLPVDSNVWSFLASIQSQERSKFKSCTTANAQPGNCMPIQLCSVPNVASSVDELVSNVCVIDEVFVGFCCPEFPVETVNVEWDGLTHEKQVASKKNSSGCGSLPESLDTGNIWPWMVTLVTTSNEVFCGGVLISEKVVLAAAHCTKRIPLNQILVRVRSLESPFPFENIEVVEIKRHAQYNPKTMLNDLALLELSKKFESTKATPICLPDASQDYVGENGILLGWKAALGDTTDVEWLPIISKEDCRKRLGLGSAESILCSEPRAAEATCNADTGAPLVLNLKGKFTLIGVLTWNRHDCDGMQPTIFTRISSFQKWIEKHSRED